MLERAKELSTEPDSEGLVLLAHGSASFKPIWDNLCREIGSYICSKTGIDIFDYAFVEIGQSFINEGIPVILKTAEKRRKTIVVGIYVSMGVANMSQNTTLKLGNREIKGQEMLAGKNVLFAEQGLLPDKQVAEWISNMAAEWAKGQ